MRGMRDVARDVGSVLMAREWESLASLIDRNWDYQLLLDATMATAHSRSIESAIRDAGAWGLKATGEGAGGCFLAVCPPERKDRIATAAAACGATAIEVQFSAEGVTIVEKEDVSGAT